MAESKCGSECSLSSSVQAALKTLLVGSRKAEVHVQLSFSAVLSINCGGKIGLLHGPAAKAGTVLQTIRTISFVLDLTVTVYGHHIGLMVVDAAATSSQRYLYCCCALSDESSDLSTKFIKA